MDDRGREGLPLRLVSITDVLVSWVEGAVAAILALLSMLSAVFLVVETARLVRHPSLETIQALFSSVLLVFIMLELYSLSVSFLKGEKVVDKVFEVGTVTLVRQLVVSDIMHFDVSRLMAFAALIVALGVSWYLSHRAEYVKAAQRESDRT